MDRCYWLRSGDWVAGLCVLHVVRSDLRLGQQFWAADGDFLRDEDKGAGSKFFLLVGKRLFSVAFGPWAGGRGKIV